MHMAYVNTHQQNHTILDCSLCVDDETKAEIVKRLLSTLSYTNSADIISITLFCLGVLHTGLQADEITFQNGLEYLQQALTHRNKQAVHYLARIYSGCHQYRGTLSLNDEEPAIHYYLTSFKLDSYEALNDLMSSLRLGEGDISKDKDRWYQFFIQLFLEAAKNENLELIPHLIRCLIQQNYVLSKTEPFLVMAAEIIHSWMTTSYWKPRYTRLVQGYLEQEQKKGNQGTLYLFYKLDFSKSSTGTHFFNSKNSLSNDDWKFIQSIEQLHKELDIELPVQNKMDEKYKTFSVL
ncbi:hypothetical protein [Legionella sp. PC997]|uniref:hypothetical protein n=1 Tax=Legionella sp. PC997 TaxID=2755562 RepID=UPI0015FB4B5A|nr:hypothetical protein [Legionella sp. PC997]QMT59579.1 hypothetical protein HBNCFIEN_00945 [Legionella sp. PC997]